MPPFDRLHGSNIWGEQIGGGDAWWVLLLISLAVLCCCVTYAAACRCRRKRKKEPIKEDKEEGIDRYMVDIKSAIDEESSGHHRPLALPSRLSQCGRLRSSLTGSRAAGGGRRSGSGAYAAADPVQLELPRRTISTTDVALTRSHSAPYHDSSSPSNLSLCSVGRSCSDSSGPERPSFGSRQPPPSPRAGARSVLPSLPGMSPGRKGLVRSLSSTSRFRVNAASEPEEREMVFDRRRLDADDFESW